MKFAARFGFAVVAAVILASCGNGTTAAGGGVEKIVSTTSFGMCVGYCTTRLEISATEAVLVRQARGGRGAPEGKPDQRFATPLAGNEWAEIATLAAATKLDALPDTIGCPDCADGGAESLSIVGAGRNKTITFDHGAEIKEAQPLLDRVRALRQKLTPQE